MKRLTGKVVSLKTTAIALVLSVLSGRTSEPLPPKFDAGALFAEKEDSATSIMMLPQAEDGELPREISEVEGATVTIETKTR